MNLSTLAKEQLNEIQYAFGCSKNEAISYALESLHAFENITEDQVYNYLDSSYKDKLAAWEMEHANERVKLENN